MVLVRVDNSERWQYGEFIRVRGLMETPPVFEGFSYRDYLARQGIHSIMPTGRSRACLSRAAETPACAGSTRQGQGAHQYL